MSNLILDVPSLVSGSGIAFIDPQEVIYRANRTEGRPTSSYRWDMNEHRRDMMDIPDQWEPFYQPIFGFSEDNIQDGRYDHMKGYVRRENSNMATKFNSIN